MFQLLIESYTNLIVGKGIHEIQSNAYDNIRRFDSMPGKKLAKGETIRTRITSIYRK